MKSITLKLAAVLCLSIAIVPFTATVLLAAAAAGEFKKAVSDTPAAIAELYTAILD